MLQLNATITRLSTNTERGDEGLVARWFDERWGASGVTVTVQVHPG